MYVKHFLAEFLLISVLLCPFVAAQEPAAIADKNFSKDGLTFNYPGDWTLTDKSTPQALHLILARPASSTLIMVIAFRDPVSNGEEFHLAMRNITEPYIDSIAKNLSVAGHEAKRDAPCVLLGDRKLAGTRVRGVYRNEPTTGEVYAFVRARKFVNLVYLRPDKEGTQSDKAWETIRNSLTIEGASPEPGPGDFVSGGVLNGKAISLPRPEYSSSARGARASGTVNVQVTIDEKGNVTAAKAVTGHHLLHEAAVDAAKRAKFSPTRLCGDPVKVTGVITYNFIAQ